MTRTVRCNGDAVRRLREEMRWKQNIVARESHVDAKTLRKMESGGSVRLDKLASVAKVLSVSVEQLMDESARAADASVKTVLLDTAAPDIQIRHVRVLPADGRTLVNQGRESTEYRWHVLPGPISDAAVKILEELNEFLHPETSVRHVPQSTSYVSGAEEVAASVAARVYFPESLSEQLANIRKGRDGDQVLERLNQEGLHILTGEYIRYEGFVEEGGPEYVEETALKLCVVAPTIYHELLIGVDKGDSAPVDLDTLRSWQELNVDD